MEIVKNGDMIIIENETGKMSFIERSQGCFFIDIAPLEDGKRTFSIPNASFTQYDQCQLYQIFERFMMLMFGNNVIRGEYGDESLTIDFDFKTIFFESDSGNASLLIYFGDRSIDFKIERLTNKQWINSAIYFQWDCNLRGGYVNIFRELYEKLSEFALKQTEDRGRN